MNCRLCFVLLSVAIVAVKGSPGAADGMWAKFGSRPLKTTPVKVPFAQSVVAQARSAPIASAKDAPVKQPVATETVVRPNKRTLEIPVDGKSEHVEQPPKPAVEEPEPPKKEIPIFAKMILGDPAHPKLASMEELRKADLRSVNYNLELPNKHTMPLVKELLEKSADLLRLFQEIQEESNGFVDDIEKHNKHASDNYIGYYN